MKKHLAEGVVTELQEVAGHFVTSQREEKVLAQMPQIVWRFWHPSNCNTEKIKLSQLFFFLFRRVSPLIQGGLYSSKNINILAGDSNLFNQQGGAKKNLDLVLMGLYNFIICLNLIFK